MITGIYSFFLIISNYKIIKNTTILFGQGFDFTCPNMKRKCLVTNHLSLGQFFQPNDDH